MDNLSVSMHIRYKLLFFLVLINLVFIGGCSTVAKYATGTEKYQRTVNLSKPFTSGSTIEAESHNGYISTVGRDITTCDVTATITAYGKTQEEAKELAEKTDVSLVPAGNGLVIKVDAPAGFENQTPSVSFDIEMPNRADMKFTSHNGRINITDITGDIDATTHNGSVEVKGILDGKCRLETHNGDVSFAYANNARPTKDIDLKTHNGGIDLTTPSGFSADIDASTHNGSVSSALPVTMKGKIDKDAIRGTIGNGGIKVKLETHNGSIEIR